MKESRQPTCRLSLPFTTGGLDQLRAPQTGQAVRRRVRGYSEGRAMGVKGNGRTRINVLVVRNHTTLFTDVLARALASEPSVLLSQPLTAD